jgi:hypothetical protein
MASVYDQWQVEMDGVEINEEKLLVKPGGGVQAATPGANVGAMFTPNQNIENATPPFPTSPPIDSSTFILHAAVHITSDISIDRYLPSHGASFCCDAAH